MWITKEQAANVYARFAKARYGRAKASLIAERRAAELQRKGDADGQLAWKEVKRALESDTSNSAHDGSFFNVETST